MAFYVFVSLNVMKVAQEVFSGALFNKGKFQKNVLFHYDECRYVECRYAECRGNTKIAHVGRHDRQHNDIHHIYKSNATLSTTFRIMTVLLC